MTISEQLVQRSDLIGTQVITRDTGKKLGVINQLWVDIDQREVVAVGLRNTLFTGEQRYMFLNSIRQVGDVILVEDEDAIEDVDALNYSSLIDNEVITETGELLGKVRGFKFDINNGRVSDLVVASFGLPWIPAQLISTYELPVDEIVSTGPERLIVFEGAEERLNQLTVGLMERLGIGAPPWEQAEEEYVQPVASTSNQLSSGARAPSYQQPVRERRPVMEEVWEERPVRRSIPARQETWSEEEDWAEERPDPRQQPQRSRRYQPEPEPEYDDYDDYDEPELEEDNWATESADAGRDQYSSEKYADLQKDAWADEEEYHAPQVNIPEKRKAPEYEPEEY